MNQIDKDKFIFMYVNTYGELKDSQENGIRFLLDQLMKDDMIKDIRQAAYMLATVKHECAGTWQPIAEYGKGQGKKYGSPDHSTGKVYYGRGYVQLTWADNYIAMGNSLGIDLLHDPDQAMIPDVAYAIMSKGMRKGMFTGAGLQKYISEDKCDYMMARKIINGLDCAQKIADYAVTIETMLKSCEVE